MLVAAGIIQATPDRRLCNAYSLDGQFNAGSGVAVLGIVLAGAWALRLHRTGIKAAAAMPGRR